MGAQAGTRPELEGLTQRFAELAAGLRYEDLPDDVALRAKLILRDGIGNQIAASAISEVAGKIVDLAAEWGGAEQATVVGHGIRVPAPMAALCNGTLGHGVELDDSHGSGLIKAGSVLVPAALAAAELGRASGKDVIAALVAGYEVSLRIAKAINPGHRQRGYHTTSTVGAIGASVIAARLLGLDAGGIAHALGLAAMNSGGIQAYLDDPCMAKPLGPGRAAFNGVLAAVLASRGVTGPRKVLEGREGFLNAFTDSVRVDDLLGGLGERFVIMENGFKPHSACRYAHGPIDLAQHFHGEGVRAAEVDGVLVRMSELAIRQASKPESGSLNTAMGSTEFGVALGLVRGSNGLRDYWEGFEDTAVHALARRVALAAEPEFGLGGRQAIVEVRLKGGAVLRARSEEPKGEPTSPLSREDLDRKFFATAGMVLDDAQTASISRALMALESEPRAASLLPLTVAPSARPALRAA